MKGLLAVLNTAGFVQMVAAPAAVAPYTYINALKIDSLKRVVVVFV